MLHFAVCSLWNLNHCIDFHHFAHISWDSWVIHVEHEFCVKGSPQGQRPRSFTCQNWLKRLHFTVFPLCNLNYIIDFQHFAQIPWGLLVIHVQYKFCVKGSPQSYRSRSFTCKNWLKILHFTVIPLRNLNYMYFIDSYHSA